MLKLLQNEWMKLWAKKGTWVMAGLVVILVIGMVGLVKWTETLTADDGTPDWRTAAQAELTQDKSSLDADLLKGESKRMTEERVMMNEYRLANNVPPIGDISREGMIYDPSVGSIALLLTVIVAAGIVASEFSQGTIKMLLTRPVKRWKILTSKYAAVLLFGVLLMIIGFATTILCAFIFFPAGGGQALAVSGGKVVEVSVWSHGLYVLLLSFGNVVITASFAFMIGSVFRSSGMAIGLSLFIYFTGNIVVSLLSRFEIVKYLLFTHMDLTIYESNFRLHDDITLPFSLAVLAVYWVIFLIISYGVFTKRDITA
ncbi:ABC transporter permease [Sporosarcina trichiuri]|uniref:ABC transporter permease n=1 Tax=Sporosarcina trichiuri TaxID=3056445 RepID=UPI0025B36B48|nr:ABC transporter permease [Sporosarcina sp. 0.2-SM1T-5]WJY26860.1 ABC transporter permease [Sporosarcina sp. 0.2-SM1T-5]